MSLACPWAHRAIVLRRLKGLEHAIGMTLVDPIRDDSGWRFKGDFPDPLNGWDLLSEGYDATDPGFEGRVSVPVLWDTETGRIVNNESADVIEMLDECFQAFARHPGRLQVQPAADYPALHPYLRDLYQEPGVAETVDFDHIKRHYYGTHKGINPTGIIPAGPVLDLAAPHGRG